jgi:hypothetical protein
LAGWIAAIVAIVGLIVGILPPGNWPRDQIRLLRPAPGAVVKLWPVSRPVST